MIEYGLQGKVALVSGINNVEGIGAACAFALAAQGAKLVLVYKPVPHPYDAGNTHRPGMDRYFRANAGDAAQVEQRLQQMGADYLLLERDITDEAAVAELFDAAQTRFGGVDILINNAAFADEDGTDTMATLTGQTIRRTFGVNVGGTLLMSREFLRRCRAGGHAL